MEELKTRSFRISEEVSDKLKAICTEFDNQNSALDSLIKAYEIQKAKSVIIDRQAEVSDLDTHLQAIQTAFLRSLELNENAEQRIRAEFSNLLSSKDETIMQLQFDKAQLQRQAEQSETAYSTLIQATDERIKAMQEKVSESESNAQNAKERATVAVNAKEQAEKIAAMTMEQAELLKRQVAELTVMVEQVNSYKLQAEQSDKELLEQQRKISELERQLIDEQVQAEKILQLQSELATEQEQVKLLSAEIEKMKWQQQIEIQKAVLEIKEQYQTKITELQAQQTKQLEKILSMAASK